MAKKIVTQIPEKTVQGDLKKYALRAIELGATASKVISADDVIVDERVRAKCMYPKCSYWGTNPHCPPHSIPIEEARTLIKRYKHGILLDLTVPADFLIGANSRETGTPSGLQMYDIVSRIEAEAFYDGYYLALGFGAGSCKRFYCPKLECSALTTGQPCRHPLRSRPSMESMGIDAYAMAASAGWEIYPIGGKASPADIPCGHRLGLVLVD